MSKKLLGLRVVKLLFVKLVLSLFLLSLVWVLLYRWVAPPATLHMLKRRAEAGAAGKDAPQIRYAFVPLEEMSDQLPLAVVASEDQRFPDHNGFDVDAAFACRKM